MVPLLMCSGFKTYSWYSDRDELYIYVASRLKSQHTTRSRGINPHRWSRVSSLCLKRSFVKTTVILSMSIGLLVFLLGMFINFFFFFWEMACSLLTLRSCKTRRIASSLSWRHFHSSAMHNVATFPSPQLLPISTLPNPRDYIGPKELWHRRHRSPNTL
jgi:hypothetical protein